MYKLFFLNFFKKIKYKHAVFPAQSQCIVQTISLSRQWVDLIFHREWPLILEKKKKKSLAKSHNLLFNQIDQSEYLKYNQSISQIYKMFRFKK